MEYYDFICDQGLTSLRLLQRNPFDRSQPIRGLRVHVRCTDCVAAIDVDADHWATFAGMFTHDYDIRESVAWLAPAGEWKLHVVRNVDRDFTITSELDSLLDCHRWALRSCFTMSESRFRESAVGVLEFLGNCEHH